MMKYTPAQIKKAIVAMAGFVALVLTTILAVGPELIPLNYLPWVQVTIAVIMNYGVFKVKNAKLLDNAK